MWSPLCIASCGCVMVMHTAKVGLLDTAVMSYVYSVFLAKRRLFSYDFGVSHWPADMLLWMISHWKVSYPPPIGPTLGARFSLLQVLLPLAEG